MVVKCQICVIARKQNYLLSGDTRALSLCLHSTLIVKLKCTLTTTVLHLQNDPPAVQKRNFKATIMSMISLKPASPSVTHTSLLGVNETQVPKGQCAVKWNYSLDCMFLCKCVELSSPTRTFQWNQNRK